MEKYHDSIGKTGNSGQTDDFFVLILRLADFLANSGPF